MVAPTPAWPAALPRALVWPARVIATAGGAGYSPIAPGTCGALVALPVAWATASWALWAFVLLTVVTTLIGIVAAELADRSWGTHDSGRIVIDEVVGLWCTLALADRADWRHLAVGFVVFRALDIIKPPPIRWFDEQLPGGVGVVLDDVVAGLMGLGIMVAAVASGVL